MRARAGELLSPLTLSSYRRLWSADMISLLGDWAGRLALAVVVHDRTGSPAWAAAVTAVSLAGFVGLGQALATLADRYGRITVMIVADLCAAACFAAMLLSVPVGVSARLAFLAGLASPPFEAARSAALPDLVPEDRYGPAVALSGISVQASLVLGYAFGGALLQVVEPKVALGVNAASFLVSALLVWTLRSTPAAAPAAKPATVGVVAARGLPQPRRRPSAAPRHPVARRHVVLRHRARGPRGSLRRPHRLQRLVDRTSGCGGPRRHDRRRAAASPTVRG